MYKNVLDVTLDVMLRHMYI